MSLKSGLLKYFFFKNLTKVKFGLSRFLVFFVETFKNLVLLQPTCTAQLFVHNIMSRLSCRMGMGEIWELLNGKIWEWDLSFRWEWEWDGNGKKLLKWEGFVTKNPFPHISSSRCLAVLSLGFSPT